MQTKKKSIENFEKYMDELINTTYILSDKKLTDLMRSVSTSKLFYTLFKYCTDDFDYEECFNRCFIKGDGYGKGDFILPKDAKEQIALIFSLLFQINAKEIEFYGLLERYFFVNNLKESYRKFAIEVLVPFKVEVLRAVNTMAENEDSVLKPVKTPKNEEIKSIGIEDTKTIMELLDESRSVILQYKISATQKAELIDLYQNFKDSLYDGNAKIIRISFLGYKYASLYHKNSEVKVRKIEEILRANKIL